MTAAERASIAASEVTAVVDAVDAQSLDSVVDAIDKAPRVFFSGFGRSGLMARAIAMRLMHIGVDAHVVGETTAPPIATGDLLVIFSATASSAVGTSQAEKSVKLGARVALLTSNTSAPLTRLADLVVEVPARSSVPTAQHAGSLFEQACLVIGDAVCAELQQRRGVSTAEMDARHANLQ